MVFISAAKPAGAFAKHAACPEKISVKAIFTSGKTIQKKLNGKGQRKGDQCRTRPGENGAGNDQGREPDCGQTQGASREP